MKSVKNKKTLIALAVLVFIGIIGGTFAFFTSTQTFDNLFKAKTFSTKFEEKFESPDNWVPGVTTDKEIFATNTGEVEVAVRVSYTERWVSANGNTLSGTQDSNRAAILNFANTNDWVKVGDYYVYNKKLLPNQKTTSFLESVTFNEEITADVSCTTEDSVKTCTSTGNGYDGASYTLTLTIETVQFDAVEKQWNLSNFNWVG